MNNSQYSKLWKIHKTVYEMLNDRNYAITKEQLNMDFLTWINKYKSNNQINKKDLTLKVGHAQEDETIHVYFSNEFLGIEYIEGIIQELTNNKNSHAIIVINKPIDKIYQNVLNLINNSKFSIELFQEKLLLFNITKHHLVPKHSVITKREKNNLLKTYHVKESQLPRILFNDPVIRYYGLKRGQVVKIIRPSETSGLYINYRVIT